MQTTETAHATAHAYYASWANRLREQGCTELLVIDILCRKLADKAVEIDCYETIIAQEMGIDKDDVVELLPGIQL